MGNTRKYRRTAREACAMAWKDYLVRTTRSNLLRRVLARVPHRMSRTIDLTALLSFSARAESFE